MKTFVIAAVLALAPGAAALAQGSTPTPAPASPPAASATPGTTTAPAAGAKPSVKTTPIGEIIRNPAAKAALEKIVPEIAEYYDRISSNTLTEVIDLSGGAMTPADVARVQAEFDKLP